MRGSMGGAWDLLEAARSRCRVGAAYRRRIKPISSWLTERRRKQLGAAIQVAGLGVGHRRGRGVEHAAAHHASHYHLMIARGMPRRDAALEVCGRVEQDRGAPETRSPAPAAELVHLPTRLGPEVA